MPNPTASGPLPRALSPQQQRALSAMQVEVYVRRQAAPPPAIDSGEAAWGAGSALALTLARAAGASDVPNFCANWRALGLELPDLNQLRTTPLEKRRLWRLMRAQQRRP